ncbi:MAG: SufD family Fe-S cluster assembly protein [Candidatus Izemoplasmatales bacterium]|jgi:Fe-S cluster assembly protein SufD|nr:SufD family Fe-S cluster assembly protein [Candidatus Izemoplasmatales bacterium]
MNLPRYLFSTNQTLVFDSQFTNAYDYISIDNKSACLNISFKKTFEQPLTLVFTNELSNTVQLHFNKSISGSITIIHYYSRQTKKQFSFVFDDSSNISIKEVFISKRSITLEMHRDFIIKHNALLSLVSGSLIEGTTLTNETFLLTNERANLTYQNLYIGSNIDNMTCKQWMKHFAVNSTSYVENLLVSGDESKLDFEVSGYIEKGMKGSICKQQNRGVILNEQGSVRVDPKLYINEYDVEAGHGAAIGQVNEDELFYLLSRGLDESAAKRLIISGYTEPFINAFESRSLQSGIRRKIARKVKGVVSE